MVAGEPPALAVVGCDEAHVAAALESRIDHDDRNAAARGVCNRRRERGLVERREHDAGHTAADEPFDLRHLRVAVVLPQRSAPDDRRACLARGLLGAGVDALPEDVRRALRDDGDRQPARAVPLAARAQGERREHARSAGLQACMSNGSEAFVSGRPKVCTTNEVMALSQRPSSRSDCRTAARCRRARRRAPQPADPRDSP